MLRAMGLPVGGFDSSKGKKHDDFGAVDLQKGRKYRQYMNRRGGFNRELDEIK